MEDFDLYWSKFSNDIKNKNRFFCNPEFLMEIKNYLSIHNVILDKEILLYRARIFRYQSPTFESTITDKITEVENNLTDKINSFINKKFTQAEFAKNLEQFNNGFVGYNAADSSAPPPDKTLDGRANPKGISYLYLAEDEMTCISEIKPNFESWVSIGSFVPERTLKLADIHCSKDDFDKNKGNIKITKFMIDFDVCFSQVKQDTEDYLPTQYITEFIKFLGYDGLVYSSSYDHNKKCYIIFKPSDCRCIESRLCQITGLEYKITKIYSKDD